MRLVMVVAAVLVFAGPALAQDADDIPNAPGYSEKNLPRLKVESWPNGVKVWKPTPNPKPPQPDTTIITIDREVPVYTPPAQTYVQPYYAPYYAQRPYRPHPQPTPQGEVYLPRRR